MAEPEVKAGWMHTKGRPGDRSLTQQLEALDRLVASVRGKTVLDIGSAEGLISMHLIDKGAIAAHGVEIVPGHVEVANKLRKARACMFEVGDANTWAPQRQYDVVLMLAILHKLQDPSAACRRFARAARDLVVIRLPPYGSAIIDIRSGNVPHNIEAVMREEGWRLDEETRGPLNEWVGYFVRVSL